MLLKLFLIGLTGPGDAGSSMERSVGLRAGDAASVRPLTRRVRVVALAVALAFLPLLGMPASASALRTDDYPTWAEVVAAQKNTNQAKKLAAQLKRQLSGLEEAAKKTQAEADAKGAIYAEAQQRFDEQNIETQSLLEQTAAAQAEADQAYKVAGQVIAEMSKSGRADLTPQLLTAPGSQDALLSHLELNLLLGERYSALYNEARQLRNAAKALADQAEVAQQILEELRVAAEKAFQEAQAAAEAARKKLEQTEKDIAEVTARIKYLQGVSKETTAKYNQGLIAKYGEGAAGYISESGWARPHGGYITSHFGMRYNPVSGVWQLHTGVDLAGGGCGSTIRAAHAGTVTYAGWNGSWGYYVALDHHDGTGTGYAHIQSGGILVRIGQDVAPGQPIGKVGTTGQSTGCHLHFIVRVNGNSTLTDPVPFMRRQGITLG